MKARIDTSARGRRAGCGAAFALLAIVLLVILGGCSGDKSTNLEPGASSGRSLPAVTSHDLDIDSVIQRVRRSFRPAGAGWHGAGDSYRSEVDGTALRVWTAGNADASGTPFEVTTVSVDPKTPVVCDASWRREDDGSLRAGLAPSVVEHRANTSVGVEQSWRFESMPASGDVEVRLQVRGYEFTTATESGLHFVRSGDGSGMRYGTATWVDAAGTRTTIEPRSVGDEIVLSVPSEVVHGAAYPATLDPLISPEFGLDQVVVVPASPKHSVLARAGNTYLVAWSEELHWPFEYSSALYAARVDAISGALLDPMSIFVVWEGGPPAVGTNGQDFLLAWSNSGVNAQRIRASDGALLDGPDGALVSSVGGTDNTSLRLGFHNGVYYVIWKHSDGFLHGTRLDGVTGQRLDGLPSEGGRELLAYHPSYGATALVGGGGNMLVVSDGRAVRVDMATGDRLDWPPIRITGDPDTTKPLASSAGWSNGAAAGFDGTNYVVVWSAGHLRAARVNVAGVVLDPPDDFNQLPGGIDLCTTSFARSPAFVSDADEHVLVWLGSGGTFASRVDTTGVALLDNTGPQCGVVLAPLPGTIHPSATLGAGELAVAGWAAVGRFHSVGFGTVDPAPIEFGYHANEQLFPVVASNGEDYLVAWVDRRGAAGYPLDVYAVRVRGADGTILDSTPIPLSTTSQVHWGVSAVEVASNGTDYMVVWEEQRAGGIQIRGTRVRASDGAMLDGLPEQGGVALDLTADGDPEFINPAVASDGVNYLVGWIRNPTSSTPFAVLGVRYASDGTALDSFGGTKQIVIYQSDDGQRNADFALAADREPDPTMRTFLAVWPGYAARVRAGLGRAIDQSAAIGCRDGLTVGVVSPGTDFFVTGHSWYQYDLNVPPEADVSATRVTALDGTVLDPQGIEVANAPVAEFYPGATFDGMHFWVAFVRGEFGSEGAAIARLDLDGTLLDAPASSGGKPFTDGRLATGVRIAANNHGRVLAVYSDERLSPEGAYRVRARFLESTDEELDGGFISVDAEAGTDAAPDVLDGASDGPAALDADDLDANEAAPTDAGADSPADANADHADQDASQADAPADSAVPDDASGPDAAGPGGPDAAGSADAGGCSCGVVTQPSTAGGAILGALVLAMLWLRRGRKGTLKSPHPQPFPPVWGEGSRNGMESDSRPPHGRAGEAAGCLAEGRNASQSANSPPPTRGGGPGWGPFKARGGPGWWPLALLLAVLCIAFPHTASAAPAGHAKPTPTTTAASKRTSPAAKPSSAKPAASAAGPTKPPANTKPPAAQTRSLPTGENKTGVSAQSISVPSGPGTIEGLGESFSAQPSTGIATFAVPFRLPAARGAAQPSLGISYSSASGNGVAGIGWSLGVPFIARQTDRGVPAYLDTGEWAERDRFVFNGGQELVPVDKLEDEVLPGWAAHGWVYFRSRLEGAYLRFFWNPSLQLWRVQDKAGVVELGAVGGEDDALERDPADPTRVFRWNLKRQVDAYGNEVRYYYDVQAGGLAWLTDLYYTAPAGAQGTAARSDWAYHVHLGYDARSDQVTSYRRGWQTVQSQRLVTVEVSARNDAISTGRRLVRRYVLSYASDSHASLLEKVQLEGRCDEAAVGEECSPPALELGYTHVGGPLENGFEPFATTVQSMVSSPKHSVNEDYTDLYDVNSDGLPDVVAMMPGLYGSEHGLWLNGKNDDPPTFAAMQKMGLKPVLGATASEITKHNPNLAALDLDGDGIIDLLHMPKAKTYSVYTPLFEGGKWWWKGREVSTSDQLDARIDFSADESDIRVFDVNGDGLVDVVKSAGASYEVWFALGRYPGGDGRFGTGTWTGPETAELSSEPVLRCVPWAGQAVRFSDPDVRVADMNGDGLMDIVRMRDGDVKYWPGRGDGTFGTGNLGCAGGAFSQDSYVQMEPGPFFADPDLTGLRVGDVNGDGTADLLKVRFHDVDIWLNVDGQSFLDRRVLSNTPPSPSYQNRVRLVDMNGSGTTDLLWGDGNAYKFIDLSNGKRPWLLSSVRNGLGKTTEVAYTTSTDEMLQAEKAGAPWKTRMPVVQHMVATVTVRDNLEKTGRAPGVYVTEYEYANPVWDGAQREFRGFADTAIRVLGDSNSPSSETETHFLLGERPTSLGSPPIDFMAPEKRWRDNPHEALKGLVASSHQCAADKSFCASSAGATYRLRSLYTGLDGRVVATAFASQTETWLYDTASFVANAHPEVTGESSIGLAGDDVFPASVQVKATQGTAHVASFVEVDVWGNRLRVTSTGVAGDEAITTVTQPELVPTPDHDLGETGWGWRTIETWVEGGSSPGIKRAHAKSLFDPRGNPIETQAYLDNLGSLERKIGDSLPDGVPQAAGWLTTSNTEYNAYGNVVFQAGPNSRCRSLTYDEAFQQLSVAETIFAGAAGRTMVVNGKTYTCGVTELTSTARHDRGLQAPVEVEDANGATTTVRYDPLGRLSSVTSPRPDGMDEDDRPATLEVQYFLPTDASATPYSWVVVRRQDGVNEDDPSYHESRAFMDGLGRTIATLTEADPTEDGFDWVVGELAEYDAKGAQRRKYLPTAWTGPVGGTPPLPSPGTRYMSQRFDAFGRSIRTIGLDGTVTLATVYHALSTDALDAEDLGPGVHQGTYASLEKDGHGRVKRTTERVRNASGAVEMRDVVATYLPTGETTRIARVSAHGEVARTMGYDSLGRMTWNNEPNTSGGGKPWRYVYNQSGDLVGTSDARGCGVNFAYDAAGRLVSEDYVPCEDHHAPYTKGVPEVAYWFDTDDPDADSAFELARCKSGGANPVKGRLVSVTDRASKTLSCYDRRGRAIEVAKSIASPNGVLTEPWFRRRASYDAANRPIGETTGATVNLPEGLTSSEVFTRYSARGSVRRVDSTYDVLVDRIRRDPDGLTTEIQYGDAAGTTTGFTYDDLRRVRNQTTFRSKLTGWTNDEHTQQMLLQDDQVTYDRVGNPVEIRDWRMADEWPAGAKPVTRKMQYDDLYRLTQIDHQYTGGTDDWADPFDAEADDSTRAQPMPRADFGGAKRPLRQTFRYDELGNSIETDDDTHAFFDRSLGTVENGAPTDGPYQLRSAKNAGKPGGRNGRLEAHYDPAGNLTWLAVERAGKCVGSVGCPVMHLRYEWDEIGRLAWARRWDMPNWQAVPPPPDPPPAALANADLDFAYDASNSRVRKTAHDPIHETSRHTVYIFSSLELRGADYDAIAQRYQLDEQTEVPYLTAKGVRLARVVHQQAPDPSQPSTRVFLELGDQLGSTSVVLDRQTGELVQRSTAYAYGAVESDLRPGRWGKFREDYRFTGKEDDIEVGLVYFGARYYAPLLGRWISPDPLAVHAPGAADLNLYAYVHGRVLAAVDLVGLDDVGGPTTDSETGFTAYPVYIEVAPPTQSMAQEAQPAPEAVDPSGGAGGSGPPAESAVAGAQGMGSDVPEAASDPSNPITTAAATMIPGVGELMDAHMAFGANSEPEDRVGAAIGIGVNICTLGFAPNYSGLRTGLRELGELEEGLNRARPHGPTHYRDPHPSAAPHPEAPKRFESPNSGHHITAVRKAQGRPFEVARSDKGRPTFFSRGKDPGHDHWRMHHAEKAHVGPRRGDFAGTDDELFDAYREAYKGLDDIRGDVISPDGPTVLGTNVTPGQAVDLIDAWLGGQGLR